MAFLRILLLVAVVSAQFGGGPGFGGGFGGGGGGSGSASSLLALDAGILEGELLAGGGQGRGSEFS